ncbi:hypothetical protein BGW39_000861 [Mortierella sp. 14UC]|nr:hypothetical protein BGW39_000861 [Mortierella sp. 14UC]
MAPTTTVTRFQEVTLKVEAPLLNDGATSTTKTAPFEGSSYWTVTLVRSSTNLQVTSVWSRMQHQDLTPYIMMHIVPHSSASSICATPLNSNNLAQGHIAQCLISIDKVADDEMYRFDIVFSTAKDIARKQASPPFKSREIIPLLLKDANTVDVCFTFTSDKAYSNIGLWAHRVVLSRFKVFAQLFEKEDSHHLSMSKAKNKTESDDESTRTISDDLTPAPPIDSRAIMIKVDKFSLATFCALLYFVYMDEIDLSVDTSRFVLSVSEGSLVWRDAEGKIRDPVRWPPLDQGSPWKLKDVTWHELFEAADYYGFSDLRSHCLNGTLNALNEQNAVRLVFSCDPDVKRMATQFIVDRMDVFFKKGNGDPFAAYKDHPDCHEVLVELMQLKFKKL